jgi:GT2 family glycosyltransferase
MPIRHCWHPDIGFRLSMARNRAIASTDADFLVFLDGDCIPRADFVARHLDCCPPGWFAAGARIDVPTEVHRQFKQADILSNRIFEVDYLAARHSALRRFRWRLQRQRWLQAIGNLLTWRYCVFVGSNASAWRQDILRVNGFDEAYPGYGSEDRDMGVRLRNLGIRSRYCKFSLIVLHLDHAKPYFDAATLRRNRETFKRRFRDGTTRVDVGIDSVLQRQ